MSATSGVGSTPIRTETPTVSTEQVASNSNAPLTTQFYDDLVKKIGKYQASSIMIGVQFSILMSAPNLDPDTALSILENTLSDSFNAENKNSMLGLTALIKFSENLNEAKLKNYSDSIKKSAEASAKQKSQQTSADVALGFQVAGAVFGMLAAILLTMFTLGGGAAAIVGAVIGLTTTVLDVGTRIAKAAREGNSALGTYNDPRDPSKKLALDLSIGGAVKRAMEQAEADKTIYIPPEMNETQKKEYLAKVTMGLTITMNLVIAIASVVCGGLSVAGVGKSIGLAKDAGTLTGEIFKQTAQIAAKVSSGLQIISDVGGAASMVTKGGYGITIADITFEKNELDNQRTLHDNYIDVLGNDIKIQQDYVTNRTKDINEMRERIASSISDYNQSRSRNITTM